ncbi:hypothetical protein [Ignavibacterium sp.]|uniref:hypothetical protein n=1 Tax=Ignavibacterium sp. TaxID=2651167 RepID=UPI00307F9CA0
MKEAFSNLKIIFGIDLILFFFCISGIVQISEKAKLPFGISQSDNQLFITSAQNNRYNFLNNSELIAVDGLRVTSTESVELIQI